MITAVKKILYPEGDCREISHTLRINQIVDLNGQPMAMPLRTTRIIAYRVFRISMQSTRNENITNYHLELMDRNDLLNLTEHDVFFQGMGR